MAPGGSGSAEPPGQPGSGGQPAAAEGALAANGALTADWALAAAQELLDAGRPFHAHEVLEDAWKAAPVDERALWRGLAQLAVGLTHQARGNPAGAIALLRRGADNLEPYPQPAPHGVDRDGLVSWARASADQLAAGRTGGPAPRLRR